MEPRKYLPACITETPHSLRETYALADLANIADQAARQNALNDYARRAADEIIHAGRQSTLPPGFGDIQELFLHLCLDNNVDTSESTPEKLRQRMLAPDTAPPCSDK